MLGIELIVEFWRHGKFVPVEIVRTILPLVCNSMEIYDSLHLVPPCRTKECRGGYRDGGLTTRARARGNAYIIVFTVLLKLVNRLTVLDFECEQYLFSNRSLVSDL